MDAVIYIIQANSQLLCVRILWTCASLPLLRIYIKLFNVKYNINIHIYIHVYLYFSVFMFSPSLMRASEAGHPICLGIALVYSYWICYHCIFNESVTSVTFPVIFSINLSLWNFKKLFGSREKEFVSLFLAVLLRVVIKSAAQLITG